MLIPSEFVEHQMDMLISYQQELYKSGLAKANTQLVSEIGAMLSELMRLNSEQVELNQYIDISLRQGNLGNRVWDITRPIPEIDKWLKQIAS